jgi:hypothetical protein
MATEHIWAWLQAKGKTFKVISDPEKGIIEVINDKGEILIRKTNLSKRQVEIVEKNFLYKIAKKMTGRGPIRSEPSDHEPYDPMIT